MVQLIARWLPDRAIVFVADSSFAVLDLLSLSSGMPQVSLIPWLRLDAQLWKPPPERRPGHTGRDSLGVDP
jgi:hypothetical protein